MTATLVKFTIFRPGPLGDTVPDAGQITCTPTLRRHVEGGTPPDMTVLPARFTVKLGAALYDTDGTTVLQAATPGVAWAQLEPTDAGAYAGIWGWTFNIRGSAAYKATYLVPTSASTVDFGDLVQVDPDSFDPIAPPGDAWQAALDAAVAAAVAGLVAGAPGALDTLNELAAALGDDPNYAATIAAALAANAADIDAEAILARNADNLTSGTVADARVASTITRDSEVEALVAAELVDYQPGLEIGYAERTTSATSTQTAPNVTGTISGLSVTVVGAGRAVDIRFAAALSWNSVANKQAFSSLMVNAAATGAAGSSSSPVTTTGPGQQWNRRMVLTDSVSYTFTVALYTEAGGGTVTAFANATYPMALSVTNR